MGVTQSIQQGEGGEQGDPLMPMLFALGQHGALEATQARLGAGEYVFAYLDDIYTAGPCESGWGTCCCGGGVVVPCTNPFAPWEDASVEQRRHRAERHGGSDPSCSSGEAKRCGVAR